MTLMRSMPPTFGAAAPAAPVRLDGPAERIRTAVERRRPALSPRALDATACALASMYGEAYGHMYRREAVEEWLREAEVANTVQARAHQRVSRVDAVGDEQCNIPGPGAAARSAASTLPTSPTTTPHRSSTRAIPEERPAGAAREHPAGLEVA